jgi:putative serine protease PepD
MSTNRNRVVAALCVAALAGGVAGAGAVALSHGSSSVPLQATAASTQVSNTAAGASLSVAQIAKDETPGVVEVDATSTNNQSPYPGSSSESAAEGTGFIYDTSGHIVTNEHVVDGASSVRVKLADGSAYTATVVGKDISSDLAVLHIDAPASKLKPVELGDSSAMAVGDGVVAIGNPFGLDGTVTSGIVSAINREISAPDGTPIEGAIQTDAAINHGNSGGPLFDLAGKVVGVTSQIQSDSGGNDGIGFAVPSNTVKNIAGQLIAKGSVQHALLGVTIRTSANGVAVAAVESGSGAAKAGVKSGDVIVAVNGTAVSSATELRAIIGAHSPGQTLTLSVHRSGETKTLKVTLGSRTS